jgi:hypothetical protein
LTIRIDLSSIFVSERMRPKNSLDLSTGLTEHTHTHITMLVMPFTEIETTHYKPQHLVKIPDSKAPL